MSKQWKIIGRVLPERCAAELPRVGVSLEQKDKNIESDVQIHMSHVIINISSTKDLSIFETIEIARYTANPFIDYIAFVNRGYYTFVPDVAEDVVTGDAHPCPVFEPFFEGEFPGRLFRPASVGERIEIPLKVVDSAISSALHSLSQAVLHTDRTFMYCRLAIEAIRSHYDPKLNKGASWSVREAKGEQAMCARLNISRDSLKSFKGKAAKTRHGIQLTDSTWAERKAALELSWEIVTRHIEVIANPAAGSFREI